MSILSNFSIYDNFLDSANFSFFNFLDLDNFPDFLASSSLSLSIYNLIFLPLFFFILRPDTPGYLIVFSMQVSRNTILLKL